MTPKIVVGYDGSPQSEDALAFGRLLGGAVRGELVSAYVAHLEPLLTGLAETGLDAFGRAEAERVLGGLRDDPAAPAPTKRWILRASAAQGLHDIAEQERADVLVVGSTHRGRLGRLQPGSVGRRLLHGCPCAVAVAPGSFAQRAEPGLDTIAVAYDGGREADSALRAAADIAQQTGGSLRIVGVVATPVPGAAEVGWGVSHSQVVRSMHEERHSQVERAAAIVSELAPCETSLLDGDPGQLLVEQSESFDLLVAGSRGYGRLGQTLLGGVSHHLVHGAACPVLIVPRGGDLRLTTASGADAGASPAGRPAGARKPKAA